MLVVTLVTDPGADIVQDRRGLQHYPIAFFQGAGPGQIVKQRQGQPCNLQGVALFDLAVTAEFQHRIAP